MARSRIFAFMKQPPQAFELKVGMDAPYREYSDQEACAWSSGYNEAVELANARITELYQQLEDLQYALNNNGH